LKTAKLIGLVAIFILVGALSTTSFAQSIPSITGTRIEITINNLPKGDLLPSDTSYYVIKDPFNKAAIKLFDEAILSVDVCNQFTLSKGTYSIGAFNPNFGWGVKVVNVTSIDDGKSIPITLTLKPVALNWTDLKGVLYEKLMMPPGVTKMGYPVQTITPHSFSTEEPEIEPMQYWNQYYLIDTAPAAEQEWCKIGDLYSAPGVSVSLDLKFSGSMETKISVEGGPLEVCGYSGISQSSTRSLGPLSNGDSREIEAMFDYEWQLWWYGPWGYTFYEEDWVETQMYPSSARLSNNYAASPYYDNIYNIDDVLDASTSSEQTVLEFQEMQGYGWSVGESVTLSGSWYLFSGDVSLGGSFSWSSYSTYEEIYTISAQSGRVVYMYYGTGPEAPLTLQNDYWAVSTAGYGCISGSGQTSNEGGICEPGGDGDFARIYAPNSGDAAYINVELPHYVTGEIYIWAYEPYPYQGSHVYIYVSSNNYNWQYAGAISPSYTNGQTYYYCGAYYSSSFKYVSFAAFNDASTAVNIYIDRVHVLGTEY
jgi:hypothetical protein